MTQMIPEAMPVAVTVTPVAYVEVVVEGPGGLRATLHSPDAGEAYEALPEFVAALPQAIQEGLERAEQRGLEDSIGVLELTDDFKARMGVDDAGVSNA